MLDYGVVPTNLLTGHLGGDGIVGEAHCTFIVTVDGSRRLGVPHVVQDVALCEGEASRGEDAGIFGFAHERTNYRYPGCGLSGQRWGAG